MSDVSWNFYSLIKTLNNSYAYIQHVFARIITREEIEGFPHKGCSEEACPPDYLVDSAFGG